MMTALRWLAVAAVLVAGNQPLRAEDGPAGVWVGRYTCGQGETGLTLAIESGDNGTVRARFVFYPIGSNPNVPEGCFAMAGAYSPPNRQIDLVSKGWILRPKGYVTVGLSGQISADGASMTGGVDGPRCTTFELHRVDADIPRVCSANIAISKERKQ